MTIYEASEIANVAERAERNAPRVESHFARFAFRHLRIGERSEAIVSSILAHGSVSLITCTDSVRGVNAYSLRVGRT